MGNVVESIIRTIYDGSGVAKAAAGFSDVAKAAKSAESGATSGGIAWGKVAAGAALAGTVSLAAAYKISKAVVQVGADLIRTASDAEEMGAKFDTVFLDQGPRVRAELAEFGAEVGRSNFELQGFAAGLQDTFVPMGFARDKAADLSVQVVELATDLGSFNNLPTAGVIQNITSALVGETEPMRKYGVILNETLIKQEAFTLGLYSGVGAIDAQAKASAVLSLIMKSTSDAQGDAARTSESWANQMRRLEAIVLDTKVALGSELLPVVTPLLHQIGDLATDAVPLLVAAFEKIIPAVQDIVGFIEEIVHRGEDLIAWAEENKKTVQAWQELRGEVEKTGPAFNEVMAAMEAAGATQEDVLTFTEALSLAYEDVEQNTESVRLRNDMLAIALRLVASGANLAGDELFEMAQKQAAASRVSSSNIQRLHYEYATTSTAIDEQAEATGGLEEAAASADPTLQDLAQSERELTFTTKAAVYWGKRHADTANEAAEAAKELADAEAEAAQKVAEARQSFEESVTAAGAAALSWGYYHTVVSVAVPKTAELNELMFNSAVAQGASADAAAILGVALGILSEDEAEAMLKTALLKIEVERLAGAYAAGDATLAETQAGLQTAIANINGLDFAFNTADATTTAYNKKTGETVEVMDGVTTRAGDLAIKMGDAAGSTATAAGAMDAAKISADQLHSSLQAIVGQGWEVRVHYVQEGVGPGPTNAGPESGTGRSQYQEYASGGWFDAGRPMLVGDDPNKGGAWWERGYPELVVPQASGLVVGHDQLATAISVLSHTLGRQQARQVTMNFNGAGGRQTTPALQLMRSLVS